MKSNKKKRDYEIQQMQQKKLSIISPTYAKYIKKKKRLSTIRKIGF